MRIQQGLKNLVYQDYALVAAARHLQLDRDDRLLDVGGGAAYYMRRLAPRVGHAVLVDRFADMYAGSRLLAHVARTGHPFSVVCADAHSLPFADGTATKVFSNQVLEHLDDPSRFVSEVGRVLRSGGVALVLSQNAEFLARYRFPVRRLLRILLPARWCEGNSFLSGGYEAWEQAVGHLHRFTRDTYAAMATQAGLEVITIESGNGALSMALWECEAAVMHSATLGWIVRVLSRGVLQRITRAIEYLSGAADGVDLIGVFRKPKPCAERDA